MRSHRAASSLALVAAVVGLASLSTRSTMAQSPQTHAIIGDNESILIDGKTFKLTVGKAKSDSSTPIRVLGARELGPGALVFRSGEKLYIVDSPLRLPNIAPSASQDVPIGAAGFFPNRIKIEYVAAKNPEHQKHVDVLKERRVLEALQQIFSPLRLPVDLTIRTLGCGMVNAWYDRAGSSVNLCYEYLDEILQYAPKETTPAGITRPDAIIGQFLFVTAHEMGHAVFDKYNVPIFGREEDAADQFAAYVMLQFGQGQPRRLIGGAAHSYREFFKEFKQNSSVSIPLAAFSSAHGAPETRFYNLLCTAYGADPIVFDDVVENGYLPEARARGCKNEYNLLMRSFRREIRPNIDQQLARQVLDTKWLTAPCGQSTALRLCPL